jgi:hypothetical protein
MKALLAIFAMGLASCSEPAPEAPRDEVRDTSVFDPLTGTLDRAAGVEDTLRDSAADRRRQIEEAEGR